MKYILIKNIVYIVNLVRKSMKYLFVFMFFLLVLPSVSAWGNDTHEWLCPYDNIDCNIADYSEFKLEFSYARTLNHFCYNGEEDCASKLAAKYFLKRYYFEGETNLEFLGAAAHLYQDSLSPNHEYLTIGIFGKSHIPVFSPTWVMFLEGEIDNNLNKEGRSFEINHNKEAISINEEYLDITKERVLNFVLSEPNESLEDIENQIRAKQFGNYSKFGKNSVIALFFILVPFFGHKFWKRKKKENYYEGLLKNS